MRSRFAVLVAIGAAVAATSVSAQSQTAPPGSRTDVYHVHFTKAVPGE